jgi:thiamine kinase-like enzyme
MDVPIIKNEKWILQTYDTLYESAFKKFPINELIEEYNCETLKKYDIRQEIEWIKKRIIEIDSPILFCHNDFHGGNILVTEPNNNSDERIVLCDFEYSCYSYRGLDFGTLFIEWGGDINEFMKIGDFPKECVTNLFFDEYIAESVKVVGNEYSAKKSNSIEHLTREAKIFSLVSNLIFVVYILESNETTLGEEFDKKKNMV